MKLRSGPAWVGRFPTSTTTADLESGFRRCVDSFVAALRAGGARVTISATRRPPERAYLMHYAWRIAKENKDAATVPAMTGVDIEWEHPTSAMSRTAASQMTSGFGIVFRPALRSNHTRGRAIDMTVTAYIGKTFEDAAGAQVKVDSATQLHALGASYGVLKLVSDPPHWSDDGH